MRVRVFYPELQEVISLQGRQSLFVIKCARTIHYLYNVLRFSIGGVFYIFDQNNELECRVIEISKKNIKCDVVYQNSKIEINEPVLNISLACGIIKYDKMCQVVTQATELGVKEIIPLITERTNNAHFKYEKIKQHSIEALEQCGGFTLPIIYHPMKLDNFLNNFSDSMIFCGDTYQEPTEDKRLSDYMKNKKQNNKIALIGPEGGFSKLEMQKITSLSNVQNVRLQSRVMRSETAAVAMLSILKNAEIV